MTHAKPPAQRAHHLLKFIYLQLRAEGRSLRDLTTKAGVSYNTTKAAMQGKSNISLASVEALMNCLGYTTKPTTIYERGLNAATYLRVQGQSKDQGRRCAGD